MSEKKETREQIQMFGVSEIADTISSKIGKTFKKKKRETKELENEATVCVESLVRQEIKECDACIAVTDLVNEKTTLVYFCVSYHLTLGEIINLVVPKYYKCVKCKVFFLSRLNDVEFQIDSLVMLRNMPVS